MATPPSNGISGRFTTNQGIQGPVCKLPYLVLVDHWANSMTTVVARQDHSYEMLPELWVTTDIKVLRKKKPTKYYLDDNLDDGT